MQTSWGRSFQASPALAVSFLQADVNAGRGEIVRTLVWFNEIPVRQKQRGGPVEQENSMLIAQEEKWTETSYKIENFQSIPLIPQ